MSSMLPTLDKLSPCINVCVLEYGTCKGCHRTQNEIATWKWLTREEKQRINSDIKWRNHEDDHSR